MLTTSTFVFFFLLLTKENILHSILKIKSVAPYVSRRITHSSCHMSIPLVKDKYNGSISNELNKIIIDAKNFKRLFKDLQIKRSRRRE